MKIEKIKPIPKYMLTQIQKLDKELDIKPCGLVRYYAYLTKNDGELCKVTCAVKIYKGVWYCKQVAIHGLNSDKCFCRDIESSYMGGFKVGFYAEGMRQYSEPRWFEDGKWYDCEDKYFNPYARLINAEYAKKLPELKYSACELYKGECVIDYLRIYRKFPQAEYLVKLGLSRYALSAQILTLCGKDRRFRKWIANNRIALNLSKRYYVSAILTAYKENKPVEEVQRFEERKKDLQNRNLTAIRNLVSGEYERYFAYTAKQNIGDYTYLDYLRACNELGIDMTEDKNRYPHDFKYWHDVRIDERATARAIKDEKARTDLYNTFAEVAGKYMPMQDNANGEYVVVIAMSPDELKAEGEALHHCVGKMGYDQKFAREQSLIFFVRSKSAPETPLATIEYSISQKRICQFYADHNTAPSKEVSTYVNNVWLPHANKTVRTLVA